MPARSTVLTFLRWVGWPAVALATLNIETLAQALGWDSVLLKRWSPVMYSVVEILQSWWIQLPAVFILGAVTWIWFDSRLRKKELAADLAARRPSLLFDWRFLENELLIARENITINKTANALSADEPVLFRDTALCVSSILLYLAKRESISIYVVQSFPDSDAAGFLDLSSRIISSILPLVRLRDSDSIFRLANIAVKHWKSEQFERQQPQNTES